ncbi:MAG: hypothetical protein ACTHU0_23615 [Kofleriaceae bacterium]
MSRTAGHTQRSGFAIAAWALGALAFATGCPADDTTVPADAATDAAATSGLTIHWECRPDLPGRATSEATVDRAVFRLRNVRTVSDSGTTSAPPASNQLSLEWGAGVAPRPLELTDAPAGLYSRLLFDLDGGYAEYAYEISGTVEINNAFYQFVIREREVTPLYLDFALALPPGGNGAIEVRIEVDKLVKAVEFSQVPPFNSVLVIEDGNPQLDAVRYELRNAIEIHSGS